MNSSIQNNKRFLFCRLAYMKYYQGNLQNDNPHNGGLYVSKTKDALEKYNFYCCEDGKIRGFVETKYVGGYEKGKPRELHIEKIDENYANESYIDDVTVVFFATYKKKQIIIGWYRNARVYRGRKTYNGRQYNLIVDSNNTTLLDEVERNYVLPKIITNTQSNVRYFPRGNSAWEMEVCKIMNYIKLVNTNNAKEIIYVDRALEYLDGDERETVVKQRINQGVFRDKLLNKYSHCCLCNVKNPDMLLASHIKPWKDSTKKEKLDINNGLLLCANHDRLFDKGYISFDSQGKILISSRISKSEYEDLNINEEMVIGISEANIEFLKYHRDYILKK